MNRFNTISMVVISAVIGLQTGCGSSADEAEKRVIKDVADSHIQANLPDDKDFDSFLRRDLEKFFSARYSKSVTVRWEVLRQGPTQTGIAYPKYYLWVVVTEGNAQFSEGAVRLAAIDKKEFDVTDFVDVADIRASRQDISSIFPQPVCEKIRSKL